MTPVFRRKACFACANAKRRCDKQLPECQRCLDRDIDCAYPQPKRRPRGRPGSDLDHRTLSAFDYTDFGPLSLETDAGLDLWPREVDFDLVDGLVEGTAVVAISQSSTSLPEETHWAEQYDHHPIVSRPWFLREETWFSHPRSLDVDCELTIEYEPYVDAVRCMLYQWVTDGHNSFIHQKLYESGLPSWLQDAFTTLAAYKNRSPAVKNTVLQIAQDKAAALIACDTHITTDVAGVAAQLSRVQALFVFLFIRLFDGAVHPRATAESQILTLRLWLTQLWKVASQLEAEDSTERQSTVNITKASFAYHYHTSSSAWRLWILTESVRRTLLIVETILNTYQTMTAGPQECTGVVMFSTRQGLWDASSPAGWAELCDKRDPLMVPASQPELSMEMHGAEEIDDFVKLFWKYIAGPERVQSWIDMSRKSIEV
jgi:hypothetical protein